MTKTELAQRIAKALYKRDELPAADHWQTQECLKGRTKSALKERYEYGIRLNLIDPTE